jgi:uncharacterized protein DUF3489
VKLTDTQLVILSAASQREDRGIELPPKLKGGAAQKVVSNLLGRGLLEEVPAGDSLPVWRRHDHEGPVALRVTPAGLTAIGFEDASQASSLPAENPDHRAGATRKSPARSLRPDRKPKQQRPRAKQPKRFMRPDSKQAQVLAMLRRAGGVTLAAIMAKTGWQAHSVRGFLAGTVRTKLGLKLVSEKIGDKRVYRITG